MTPVCKNDGGSCRSKYRMSLRKLSFFVKPAYQTFTTHLHAWCCFYFQAENYSWHVRTVLIKEGCTGYILVSHFFVGIPSSVLAKNSSSYLSTRWRVCLCGVSPYFDNPETRGSSKMRLIETSLLVLLLAATVPTTSGTSMPMKPQASPPFQILSYIQFLQLENTVIPCSLP